MTALVLRNDKDGCAILTLNRPDKLNSLNVALFAELEAHVDAIAGETDRIGLVMLRGAGKCFSAGHDLNDISAGEKPPRPHFQSSVIEKLANLPQPVITAVHGHCYTGALELALAGDLLVCSENAKFADTHARWALTPVWGMSQRLPRRVGQPKAREMMFTCRTYSGREAEAMGLTNICVPDADFDIELEKLANHPCKFMVQPSRQQGAADGHRRPAARRRSQLRDCAQPRARPGHGGPHRRLPEQDSQGVMTSGKRSTPNFQRHNALHKF
jgi:Enoyl-CoA hydratase/carnithine racemase